MPGLSVSTTKTTMGDLNLSKANNVNLDSFITYDADYEEVDYTESENEEITVSDTSATEYDPSGEGYFVVEFNEEQLKPFIELETYEPEITPFQEFEALIIEDIKEESKDLGTDFTNSLRSNFSKQTLVIMLPYFIEMLNESKIPFEFSKRAGKYVVVTISSAVSSGGGWESLFKAVVTGNTKNYFANSPCLAYFHDSWLTFSHAIAPIEEVAAWNTRPWQFTASDFKGGGIAFLISCCFSFYDGFSNCEGTFQQKYEAGIDEVYNDLPEIVGGVVGAIVGEAICQWAVTMIAAAAFGVSLAAGGWVVVVAGLVGAAIGTAIGKFLGPIIWDGIKYVAATVHEWVTGTLVPWWTNEFVPGVKQIAADIYNNCVTAFNNTCAVISEGFSTAVDWVVDKGEAVKDWAIDTGAAVVDWAKDTGSAVKDWAIDTKDAVVDWAKDTGDAVVSWAKDTGQNIYDTAKDVGSFISGGFESLCGFLF